MIVAVSIISFLLDGIISKYININFNFLPLFTIVSLVLIYPYFKNSERYFRYVALLGFLYDIVYCNTLFYNFFIFLFLGIIISFFNYLLSNNIFVIILLENICIIMYRIINFIFFFLFRNKISFNLLLNVILHSLIINFIWTLLLYFIMEYIRKKRNIKIYK